MTADHVRPAAATFTTVVAAVPDDLLAAPTPCADLDVRGLVAHLLTWGPALVGAAHGEQVPPADVTVGDGWRADLAAHVDALTAGWSDAGAWEGDTHMGGPDALPASVVGAMVVGELVVHGWDLARAVGADPTWDDALLADLLAATAAMAPMGREMGIYGPEVAVDADAPVLDRLLAVTGRDPAWAAPPDR